MTFETPTFYPLNPHVLMPRGISITTKHGTDDHGRMIYSAEEHDRLEEAQDRMSPEQLTDYIMAPLQDRILFGDDEREAPTPSTYTPAEYKAAAKRTHRMSEEEFRDWESAPADGRVIE